MARHVAATRDGGRATFLLEVALDRARTKARLAAILRSERAQRGAGEASRFPQPEMARLLGYSLRQYQRLEDPDDPSLPRWNELERIMGELGLPASEIFSDDVPASSARATADDGVQATLRRVLDQLQELQAGQAEIADRLERLEDARSPQARRRATGA